MTQARWTVGLSVGTGLNSNLTAGSEVVEGEAELSRGRRPGRVGDTMRCGVRCCAVLGTRRKVITQLPSKRMCMQSFGALMAMGTSYGGGCFLSKQSEDWTHEAGARVRVADWHCVRTPTGMHFQ